MRIYMLKDMLLDGDANQVDVTKIPDEIAQAARVYNDTIPFKFVEGFQDHIVVLDDEGNFVDLDTADLDEILEEFLDA